MKRNLPVAGIVRLLLLLTVSISASAQTLNRGTASEPGTLDPHVATGNSASPILYDMFVGLTSFDFTGAIAPGAAESWTVSEDGLSYSFRLRENLKWSDGSPITAEDFVWSYQRLLTPATAARFASFFYAIENARAVVRGKKPPSALGVSAPDPRTVVFKLSFPAAYFLQNIASNPGAPVPRAVIEEHGRGWTRAGRMVSNGPYQLAEYVPQSHITLEKNPHFYAADSVRIERVKYYPTQNLATQFNRYLAGEIDLLLAFPLDKVDYILEEIPQQLFIWPGLGTNFLIFNTRQAPFDDSRVRRALSLAIDRAGLAKRILAPGESPAYTLVPPVVSAYDVQVPDWASQPMVERMEEARRLMQAAGYGPGKPLKIDFRYDTSESARRQVVAFRAMWRGLGVEVNALDSDFITLNKAARTGNFQLLRYAWFAPNNDPDTFLGLLSSTNPNNYSGFNNPDFDQLYRAGNANLDRIARMQQLSEAEAVALAQDPVIPIYHFTRRFLVSPRVQGFVPNLRGLVLTRYLDVQR
jgi:ABC-type oligopeptide transport system substrate-binding subunit